MAVKDYIEALAEQKNQLVRNLQIMGVTAHEREKFNSLIPKILDISGENRQVIFECGTDSLEKYSDRLFTVYNNAYNSIGDFSANYPHFFSAENDYQLNFSVDDFNWDGVVYVGSLAEVKITDTSQILIEFQSGATENGDIYLVPKPQNSDVSTAVYVYTQIQNDSALKVPFQWLMSERHIKTLSDCNVPQGDYYFAFAGRSNNTRPKVRAIKILGG